MYGTVLAITSAFSELPISSVRGISDTGILTTLKITVWRDTVSDWKMNVGRLFCISREWEAKGRDAGNNRFMETKRVWWYNHHFIFCRVCALTLCSDRTMNWIDIVTELRGGGRTMTVNLLQTLMKRWWRITQASEESIYIVTDSEVINERPSWFIKVKRVALYWFPGSSLCCPETLVTATGLRLNID